MKKFSPQRVANELTIVLRKAGVADFPVDVKSIAMEISKLKFPDDPIAVIKGASLPGFEGALSPAPPGKKGWGIFYNTDVSSPGRINFTLGHEFGHYLLHRVAYPNGFQCGTEDMSSWESEYAMREDEANTFAATLLMPIDDFRSKINERHQPDFDELGGCANRYNVSLIAATLRWLKYTSRRSMLVVSREGFVLWAISSRSARKTGIFYRTRGRPPVEIPDKSLAAAFSLRSGDSLASFFNDDVWFSLPCTEHVILSEQYDFTLSLLHFPDHDRGEEGAEPQPESLGEKMRSGKIG